MIEGSLILGEGAENANVPGSTYSQLLHLFDDLSFLRFIRSKACPVTQRTIVTDFQVAQVDFAFLDALHKKKLSDFTLHVSNACKLEVVCPAEKQNNPNPGTRGQHAQDNAQLSV
jgi:hypothetical protein